MKKRIISILMAIVLVISIVPLPTRAENAPVYNCEEAHTHTDACLANSAAPAQNACGCPETDGTVIHQAGCDQYIAPISDAGTLATVTIDGVTTSYGSHKAAFDAANGHTAEIHLTGNEAVNAYDIYTIPAGTNITLYLDGHTLQSTNYSGMLWVHGNLTIANSGLISGSTGFAITVFKGGHLTAAEGVTIQSYNTDGSYNRNTAVVVSGTADLTNATIQSKGIGISVTNGGVLNFGGSASVSGLYSSFHTGIQVADGGTAHISGGSVAGSIPVDGTVYLSGAPSISGTITVNADTGKLYATDNGVPYSGGTVKVKTSNEAVGQVAVHTVSDSNASAFVHDGAELSLVRGSGDNANHLVLAVPVYTVTLPTGEGYTITPAEGASSTVTRGDSYSFTLTLAEEYEKTGDFSVRANNKTLTPDENGVYTIANISQHQTVTVQGVYLPDYVATVDVGGQKTHYRDIREALAAAGQHSGAVIKMLADVTLAEELVFPEGTYTLDFAGCHLKAVKVTIPAGVNMILTTSHEDGYGSLCQADIGTYNGTPVTVYGNVTLATTYAVEAGVILPADGNATVTVQAGSNEVYYNGGTLILDARLGEYEYITIIYEDRILPFTVTGGTYTPWGINIILDEDNLPVNIGDKPVVAKPGPGVTLEPAWFVSTLFYTPYALTQSGDNMVFLPCVAAIGTEPGVHDLYFLTVEEALAYAASYVSRNYTVTVLADTTVTKNTTIAKWDTLLIPEGTTLTVAEGVCITNENGQGILDNKGTIDFLRGENDTTDQLTNTPYDQAGTILTNGTPHNCATQSGESQTVYEPIDDTRHRKIVSCPDCPLHTPREPEIIEDNHISSEADLIAGRCICGQLPLVKTRSNPTDAYVCRYSFGAALNSGHTELALMNNISGTGSIYIGSTINLDLNGKTLDMGNDPIIVQRQGVLHIYGSGSIISQYADGTIANYGTLSISGGTITSLKYAIYTEGTLYLSGSPSISGNDDSYADISIYYDGKVYATASTEAGSTPYSGSLLTIEVSVRTDSFSVGDVVVHNAATKHFTLVRPADLFLLPGTDSNAGHLVLSRHIHGSWHYTSDGATLTATCGAAGCTDPGYSESVTITAPTLTVYGGQGSAEVTVSAAALAGNALPNIHYTGRAGTTYASTTAPTGAGSYTASITVGDATASIDYTIQKASQTAPAGVTAENESLALEKDGKLTSVDNTMEYRLVSADVWTAITGSAVTGLAPGVYEVRFAATDNLNPSDAVQLTIQAGSKRTPQVNCHGTLDKTYDGLPIVLPRDFLTTDSDGAVTYTWALYTADRTFIDLNHAPTDVGLYCLKIQIAATNRYEAYSNGVMFRISKAVYSGTFQTSWTVPIRIMAQRNGVILLSELLGSQTIPSGMKFTNGTLQTDGDVMHQVQIGSDGISISYTSQDNAPQEIGSRQTWTATVTGDNYQDISVTITFLVEDKAEVTIQGVAAAEDLVYNGESQTGFIGTPTSAYTGSYVIRYAGTTSAGNAFSGTDAPTEAGEYTVTISIPESDSSYKGSIQLGFTIEKADYPVAWLQNLLGNHGETLSTVPLTGGFTWDNPNEIIQYGSGHKYAATYTPEDTANYKVAHGFVTVNGADVTAPTGTITIGENHWNTLWNDITFGLFFQETQTVTVTAVDDESGITATEYYLAAEKTDDFTHVLWTAFDGSFDINPNNKYVVYIRITNGAGYKTIINSDGVVLDSIAPVISGIENGKDVYGDAAFTVDEDNLACVSVDGKNVDAVDGKYTIAADNAAHTVVVTDKSGNRTEYTLTVYKTYAVTFVADSKEIAKQVVGHGRDAELPEIPAKDGCTAKWNADGKNITADTTITAEYTPIPNPDTPPTGDNHPLLLWTILMFVSAAGFVTATFFRKQTHSGENPA